MLIPILVLTFFASLCLAVFAFMSAALAPANGIHQRLRTLLGRDAAPSSTSGMQERARQALEPLSKLLPHSMTDISRTRSWLVQAGLREPRHVAIYYGIRVFFTLFAMFGAGAILGLTAGGAFNPRNLALVFIAGMLGYLLPRFFLKRQIRLRQRAIQLGLPDALDLTTICVEAGLSLDHSLQRVGEELQPVHPELSDEFRLVTLEAQAGKTRAEALRNLTLRVDVDDLRSLVAVLLQTDRFGTSIAQALRIHSDALRIERRQRAEEAAAKTTIKMVPVLVFFVFPPIFFVTLGPAVIEVIRSVGPHLRQ